MKEYLKREIERGEKLTAMQDRISKAAASGMITMEEKVELDGILLSRANHNDNAPSVRDMVFALAKRVEALEAKHAVAPDPEQPETPEEDNVVKYDEWKPWDGISNKYQYGAVVYHPGTDKLWESIFSGQNTWEPGTLGTERLWREYIKAQNVEVDV